MLPGAAQVRLQTLERRVDLVGVGAAPAILPPHESALRWEGTALVRRAVPDLIRGLSRALPSFENRNEPDRIRNRWSCAFA